VTRLWGGRFTEDPATEMFAFTESLSFDRVLATEDCAVLAAHAGSLVAVGVLTQEEAGRVRATLEEIAGEMADPEYVWDTRDEDVHTAVERALLERLSDIGPRVRAGLSRNDRVATALRLWLGKHGRVVVSALADLIEVLAGRASESRDIVLPGYTHLQRAQPVSLAHHLLAHAFALERDAQRFLGALARADESPLGAGALAGSTLGLDSAATARALGFSSAMRNSIDAVAARDFVVEFLAAGAICGMHCARLGEELVLWTSAEFGFAEFSDAYATGSSLMPQKKNPDVAELARGKAGRLIGDLTGLLVTLKGLPLAYNRDLQEDKEPLFDAVQTLIRMLPALGGAMNGIRFDVDRMGRAASTGTLLATDLAEYLVGKGVAFRAAHEVVGRVVQRALSQERDLADLDLEELRALSDSFGSDVREVLSPRASVERRAAPGPSARSVDAQLVAIGDAIARIRAAIT